MAAISYSNNNINQATKDNNLKHGLILDEEIEGLIRVYKDGYIERPQMIPIVNSAVKPELGTTAKDVVINKHTNLWVRIYAPLNSHGKVMPLLVYFHGGGFCVGSAAWSCYHEFCSNLAAKSGSVIVSVNYRLAPEHRLPAAYDDGVNTLMWVKQQALSGSIEQKWWLGCCNLSNMFLAGDSAGANIAYNVAIKLQDSNFTRPLQIKGLIFIQPFFGGETRTNSEKNKNQPPNSALTLPASDTYWRLSLPLGANRGHPWCNPLANGGLSHVKLPSTMVCMSEMDILKDRNLELCSALGKGSKKVETFVYKGVGHAFQILYNSPYSQIRVQELLNNIRGFINQ
jgi:acetyl esterase/lipase